ncbi:MAG: ABC transporter permease [Clostridia bacterium]
MNNNLLTIIKKELKRVFDDKRLVFTTMILPAISIAIIYSIMGTMITGMIDNIESHQAIGYVHNAPESFLEYSNSPEWSESISFEQADSNIEEIKEDVREGHVDILVVFEEDFEKKVNNYQSLDSLPAIDTYYNNSEDNSSTARFRIFSSLIAQYERKLIGERLGNSQYAKAFVLDSTQAQHNIVNEQRATGQGLSNLIPVLITVFLFSGGMGIGMDTIAGEKERGTMATLLITPVKRETIALGKIIGLGIVSIISALSSFTGILISLPFSKALFSSSGDMDISALGFGFSEYLQLFIIMLTMVGVFVGLISLASIFAKNVKEAGTYVTPIFMFIMILGFMNMFNTSQVQLWHHLIPIYGSVASLRTLFTFEATITGIGLTCLVNISLTFILVFAIRKMFNSEKIMFNA